MPSIPQSLLWISLVVLWLFVLVPMLISKRDAVRRTSDVALATRVLNGGPVPGCSSVVVPPRVIAATQTGSRRKDAAEDELTTSLSRMNTRTTTPTTGRRPRSGRDEGRDRRADRARLPRRRRRRRFRCASGRSRPEVAEPLLAVEAVDEDEAADETESEDDAPHSETDERGRRGRPLRIRRGLVGFGARRGREEDEDPLAPVAPVAHGGAGSTRRTPPRSAPASTRSASAC